MTDRTISADGDSCIRPAAVSSRRTINLMNGLMAFPNLVALFALSGVVAKETKDFWARKTSGEYDDGLAAAKAAKQAAKGK